MRVHPLAWPLAMASSLMYALLFADSKLYGEASLQLFFVAMSLWGWWQWLRGRGADGGALVVHHLVAARRGDRGRRHAAGLAARCLAADPLHRLQRALARRPAHRRQRAGHVVAGTQVHRELVASWIAVNVFSVALFGYKHLWLTVVLYALFAALSGAGLRSWRRLAGQGHVRPARR